MKTFKIITLSIIVSFAIAILYNVFVLGATIYM